MQKSSMPEFKKSTGLIRGTLNIRDALTYLIFEANSQLARSKANSTVLCTKYAMGVGDSPLGSDRKQM